MFDKDAQVIAKYSYDAWGVCTVTQDNSGCNIAHINPFRYRGYFFDEGTGLYYLQSRYYDASVGRFVNGDSAEFATNIRAILCHNLCGYCKNNAVMYADYSGNWYYSAMDYYNKKIASLATKHPLIRRHFMYKNKIYSSNYKKYRDQFFYNTEKFGNFSGYIYGQGLSQVSNMKFGNAKIAEVGCELIAIYNIMKLLKKGPYFPDIISECYINGLAWNNGKFGINPKQIYKYFNAHGISYKKSTNFNKWISDLKSKKRGIMSAWNAWYLLRGLHTVMITYKNQKYYVYNAYKNSEKENVFSNQKELKDYMEGPFIIGYTF